MGRSATGKLHFEFNTKGKTYFHMGSFIYEDFGGNPSVFNATGQLQDVGFHHERNDVKRSIGNLTVGAVPTQPW